jgi:hypothetical protein
MSLTRRLATTGIGLASMLYGCSQPMPTPNENTNPPMNENLNEGLSPALQRYYDSVFDRFSESTIAEFLLGTASNFDKAVVVGGNCSVYLVNEENLSKKEDVRKVCDALCDFYKEDLLWPVEDQETCKDFNRSMYDICDSNPEQCTCVGC